MLRILTSKRYWSLIGKIADDQETIKGQAKVISAQQERISDLLAEIKKQEDCIDYLNDRISVANNRLLKYLPKDQLSSIYGIMQNKDLDFPSTERIPDPKTDINQILEQ